MIAEEKSDLISKYFTDSDSMLNNDFLQALETFIKQYKQQKQIHSIPIELFSNRKLGVLELVVKYLKENNNLNYHQIAVLLNRDERTVWNSYRNAVKKHKELLTISKTDKSIDISNFANRKNSPLGSLIRYLKQNGLNLKQISILTNRSYKTIWLTYKKRGGADNV